MEATGDYVTVDDMVYFRAILNYKKNVNSGSGATPIMPNLPAPYDATVRFAEKDLSGINVPTNLIFETVWRTSGSGTAGTYHYIRGMYKHA